MLSWVILGDPLQSVRNGKCAHPQGREAVLRKFRLKQQATRGHRGRKRATRSTKKREEREDMWNFETEKCSLLISEFKETRGRPIGTPSWTGVVSSFVRFRPMPADRHAVCRQTESKRADWARSPRVGGSCTRPWKSAPRSSFRVGLLSFLLFTRSRSKCRSLYFVAPKNDEMCLLTFVCPSTRR